MVICYSSPRTHRCERIAVLDLECLHGQRMMVTRQGVCILEAVTHSALSFCFLICKKREHPFVLACSEDKEMARRSGPVVIITKIMVTVH